MPHLRRGCKFNDDQIHLDRSYVLPVVRLVLVNERDWRRSYIDTGR